MEFKPYDPLWMVELAEKQRPDLPWLPEAIAKCTLCHKRLQGRKKKCIYIHFVDPKSPEWQYKETISLDHPVFGHIKLDVLSENALGGVEFYDRLFSSGKPNPP